MINKDVVDTYLLRPPIARFAFVQRPDLVQHEPSSDPWNRVLPAERDNEEESEIVKAKNALLRPKLLLLSN